MGTSEAAQTLLFIFGITTQLNLIGFEVHSVYERRCVVQYYSLQCPYQPTIFGITFGLISMQTFVILLSCAGAFTIEAVKISFPRNSEFRIFRGPVRHEIAPPVPIYVCGM